MIRNVIIGMALIIGTGWILAQPGAQQQLHHSKSAHYAIVGFLLAMAVFVIASIVQGLRKKKPGRRTGTPYAASAKRR